MINDDDDWENTEAIVLNVEQLKQIKERKLVEDSDNALTRELFEEDETLKEMIANELKKSKMKQKGPETKYEINNTEKKPKNIKVYPSKQEENELKQKEMSKKIKQQKILKARYHELFGEAEFNDDQYADYEDKYL